jgi:hypothetical protein
VKPITALPLAAAAFSAFSGCGRFAPLPAPADAPVVGHAASVILPGAPRIDDDEDTGTSLPARYQDIKAPSLRWTPPRLSSFSDTLTPGVVVFWVPDTFITNKEI